MKLLSFLRKMYYPLNRIEISSAALVHNYRYLAQLAPEIAIAPVLKSNAYGHSLVLVAKILDEVGAPFFCVDSLYEAYELLKYKIRTPILIMGYVNPDNLKVKKLPFSYAVYDRQTVAAISKYQPHANIHLFIDTGMHREGISIEELPSFLQYIKTHSPLRKGDEGGFTLEGVMSHLAAPDQVKESFTQKQISNFKTAREIVRSAGFTPKWFHLAASGGLLHHEDYHGKIGNVARAGISLYGYDPEGKDKNLRPALRLITTLTQVKRLLEGEKVGYDFTFTAPKDMTIGNLPLGYHDGVDRRLSNKGFVTIKGVACPIIGRVSMNLTTIDLSEVPDAKVGDEVVVYSDNPADKNSITNVARVCDTIPYDILVNLAASTRRIIEK
jgi:alanine racemase